MEALRWPPGGLYILVLPNIPHLARLFTTLTFLLSFSRAAGLSLTLFHSISTTRVRVSPDSSTMAFNKGVSPRMRALALATVLLLFVSMEVRQVQADSCDQQGILSKLSVCLSLTTPPAPGSPCCDAMNDVHYNIKPSDDCICGIAKSSFLATIGLDLSKIKLVISTCVGPAYVPGCLN